MLNKVPGSLKRKVISADGYKNWSETTRNKRTQLVIVFYYKHFSVI